MQKKHGKNNATSLFGVHKIPSTNQIRNLLDTVPSAVTPVIVSPNQSQVIPLPPEFIQPQDGHEKQDCELAASKRWLKQWGKDYSSWKVTFA